MNNGQLSVTAVQAVTQLVTQDPAVSAALTADGSVQQGGDFSGVLNGVQHVVKDRNALDSGQSGQGSHKAVKGKLIHDASVEIPVVDLLAQLNVSLDIATASESVAPQQETANKDTVRETVPHSEPADASQMAMAAYSQTGRIPDIAALMLLSVGGQQNVATVSTQPVVAEALPESGVVTPTQLAIGKESQLLSSRMSEVNKPTTLPVEKLPNVASLLEQATISTSTDSKRQLAEQPSGSSTQVSHVVLSGQRGPVKEMAPESSPTMISASLDTGKVEQTKPVQVISTQKTAVSSEAPSNNSTASVKMASPESSKLSQPQQIADQVSAETAVTVKLPVGLAHEVHGGKQSVAIEQQVEKVRANNEPGAGNETGSTVLSAASDGESALGSDTAGGNKDQGQHDSASDNQMLAQQMRGQFSTDHQKVAALSGKPLTSELVKQELSEQVMQQVKDRLTQHDVKPGNQQVTLTLSPDSLGEVKINLNLQGQKLSVEIMTDNRTVRDAIAQHTDALKESLARQNITMESFDVTSGGKGSDNQGQNQNAWRELAKQQQQQQTWASPRGYRVAQADLPSSQAYQRKQGHSMLDIHY